jgi:hypothetical protein
VKVDNLLGPYLYQYKKLSLPGIGLFTLAENAVLPDDNAKIKAPIEGISFTTATGARLDDSLIQYVKDQTGKMKALAEADLYSFIATAFQYLNIGKPFYFEGIGTLLKNKDNAYTFTPGTVIAQKTEDIPHRHVETKRKSVYDNDAVGGGSVNSGKIAILSVVVITLALIGWGGYYLYNKNTGAGEPITKNAAQPETRPDTTATSQSPIDSSGINPATLGKHTKADSTGTTTPVKQEAVALPAGAVKFILETTQKKIRAAKRYEQLKGVSILKQYNNTVAVETKDSVTFTIVTIVNCTPADTARVKEQLNAWYYGGAAIKVKIAQ